MAALITRWKSGVLDRAYPALGADRLGISHHRHHSGRLVGLLRARLGRYWHGTGGECLVHAVLVGTALVHSITVQERRRMLPCLEHFSRDYRVLVLSLLGTFLVRSGVLSSVHAFRVDPGARCLHSCLHDSRVGSIVQHFSARGRYQEAEEGMTSMLSRESDVRLEQCGVHCGGGLCTARDALSAGAGGIAW